MHPATGLRWPHAGVSALPSICRQRAKPLARFSVNNAEHPGGEMRGRTVRQLEKPPMPILVRTLAARLRHWLRYRPERTYMRGRG
jgi:hypothetical protein